MKNLFKLTLLVLAILLPSTATAYDFEVDGIYYTTNGNEAIVADGILCSGDVIIPEIVTYEDTTYTVTAIGSNAFYSYEGNYWLSSITIPNTVTTIGSMAFSGCIGLTSITIPNSVVAIHDGAFWRCGGLTSIIVESGNPKYDSRKNCNALIETASNTLIVGCQNTTIPNSVITIGVGAFSDCRITSINIPNSVTTVGDYAFEYCSGLTSVTIPNSIISIGESAFSGCQLDSVNITDIAAWCNICFEDIYANPLSYANHLYLNGIEVTDLTIPNTITSISKYAFAGCRSLTSVNIGNSVTTIGESVFRSSGLTSVTIGNSVTTIGDNAFSSCNNLTNVTIGNSVTTIGESAFCCSGLTSATIPNSVTYIGNDAFAGCTGLSIVTIPNSVTTIGDNAFSNCSILNEVYSYITDPLHITMGFNVFSPYNSNRTLYVPEGTFEVYSTYSRWSDYFGSIVEMEFEPTAIAESIQLNVTTAGLNEGATLQLTAMVQPEEGTSKKMNWASSNPSIATVDDNGLVTTHSVGTATITAMTTDGSNLSASCTVTLLPVGLKGDVNEDGRLNISDVSDLIDMLLGN